MQCPICSRELVNECPVIFNENRYWMTCHFCFFIGRIKITGQLETVEFWLKDYYIIIDHRANKTIICFSDKNNVFNKRYFTYHKLLTPDFPQLTKLASQINIILAFM